MKVRDDLIELDLDDFVEIATQRKLANTEDLEQFATFWRIAYNAGVSGFGDETTLEDWMGGVESWRSLMAILNAARRQSPDLAMRLEAWMSGNGPLPEFRITRAG
jgi:hypothetical protein